MPTLLYCDVDGVDRTVQIGPQPVLIGRAVDCAIRSEDPRMSRQHARLWAEGEQCWVEDLGSANGVFVGFERVQRAPVPPGEVVVIGSLLVQVLGPNGVVPPPPSVTAQLSQWLAMERKARAAVEEERNAFAKRVGELHQAGGAPGGDAGGDGAAAQERDEAVARAVALEQALAKVQDELQALSEVGVAGGQAMAELGQVKEKVAALEAEIEENERWQREVEAERSKLVAENRALQGGQRAVVGGRPAGRRPRGR